MTFLQILIPYILQISHAKTFKMKYTGCPYNNIIQKYSKSHKDRLCVVRIFMDQTLIYSYLHTIEPVNDPIACLIVSIFMPCFLIWFWRSLFCCIVEARALPQKRQRRITQLFFTSIFTKVHETTVLCSATLLVMLAIYTLG